MLFTGSFNLHQWQFALHLMFVPLLLLAVEYGGWFILGVPVFGYVLIPIVDIFLRGQSRQDNSNNNPTKNQIAFLIRFWPIIQFFILFYSIHSVSNSTTIEISELIATAAITGIITGAIGITFAHELMHKKTKLERWLADILMGLVMYGHFRTEHLNIHHRYVGTPKDAATAKFNENIFIFLTRVIPGCFCSAWNEEKTRLKKTGKRTYSLQNPFWQYSGLAVTFTSVAALVGGTAGILFFVTQAVVAIIHLELANYIEHYGLQRRETSLGRYEPTRPHHSWNSNEKASNWLLINLQLHSDHHAKSNKDFLNLKNLSSSQAPQLPFGYPVMIILSLIPPIWFKIMNPRVAVWKKQFDKPQSKF